MFYIENNSLDPFFNLALEEYLLKKKESDFLILWRSENSVVVGKHQNLHAELKQKFAIDKQIKIARRLSGGGTVFHDLGNLNFTFIQTTEPGKMVDFKKHISPIVGFINSLGVPATITNRNDITINSLKVSGNAEHVFKNKVIHHGTLLYNSDLSTLNGVLRDNNAAYISKAVKSVRSAVTNISDYLLTHKTIREFAHELVGYLTPVLGLQPATLSSEDLFHVEKLSNEKYRTWEWVYGYSPNFQLQKRIAISNLMYDCRLSVKKGIVSDVSIKADNIPRPEIERQFLSGKFDYTHLNSKSTDEIWSILMQECFA